MSKHFSHLNSAVQVVSSYDGKSPFSVVIKQFFKANKKYGSKDRRAIRSLCYEYFRVANMCGSVPDLKDKIIIGHVLCNTSSTPFLEAVKPDLESCAALTMNEKLAYFNLRVSNLFPFKEKLTNEIDYPGFAFSHLAQPKVFLRYRNGKKDLVKSKLSAANIAFNEMDEFGVSVAANAQLAGVFQINYDAVVQDYGSQQVRNVLAKIPKKANLTVWDCCAASGGKSILATDVLAPYELVVSDVRSSILHNLKRRFKEAGIKKYKAHMLDMSKASSVAQFSKFDVVIADVPCSGSGTWGRTPERMQQITEQELAHFHKLQNNIASNAFKQVKAQGYMVYITCSVYMLENEAVLNNIGGTVVFSQLFNGALHHSDSMFMALIQKK